MLHGQRQVLLREVEHVEDDVFLAAVLAVVDGVHHLDDGLALMHRLLLAVLTDDGQFALHQTESYFSIPTMYCAASGISPILEVSAACLLLLHEAKVMATSINDAKNKE